MRTFAQKQNQHQERVSSSLGRSNGTISGPIHHTHPILHLQRMIGNQAVQRLVQANAEDLAAGSAIGPSAYLVHDVSQILLYPKTTKIKIQPKLTVGTPGDIFEQEADRVADQVMRMPAPQLQRAQTKPKLGDSREQTSLDGAVDRLPHGGAALPAEVRGFMEPRFGYDFAGVRIHANNHLALRIQARAFTVGSDIYFAPGEFQPNTPSGQRIIGHELTHTIQQGAVPEQGAGRAARSSLTGSISRTPIAIQREVGESQVASSGQVLTRIGARVTAADAHADAIVRIVRALNSIIPGTALPQVAQLRELIAYEPLFRAGTADLLRLIELAFEFNPGAGKDSPLNAFVYTCRCGWIDMGHFFFSAAAAYGAGFLLRFVNVLRAARLGGMTGEQASLILGWYMEHFQEALRLFATGPFGALLTQAPTAVRAAVMGNVRSAFTVEDLPSDAYGARIGQEVYDDWWNSLVGWKANTSITEPEPFDIRSRMTGFFSDCAAVFPTGQTRRAMVEEAVGTGKYPRQHFSTTPVLLTSALGLCPVPETACPPVDERGWESAHPAGMIEEASDRTTLWNFAVDVAALKAEHQERLRQAAAAAPARAMIMVEGYASCSGSSSLNERLARSRAETATAFLRAQRPDLRVGLNYFGERTPRPAVTAGDGEAMARNRRVEIYVVDVARTHLGLPAFRLPTPVSLPMPVK